MRPSTMATKSRSLAKPQEANRMGPFGFSYGPPWQAAGAALPERTIPCQSKRPGGIAMDEQSQDALSDSATAGRPNIVLILADDLGFSDLGCYGSEIRTPAIDQLAADGTRLARFYSTPRCSPSRASLMTGLHPHQVGLGILTQDDRPFGYRGSLSEDSVTLAEALKAVGYSTCLAGKWHLTSDVHEPNAAWPTRRGFDEFFGTLVGCGSYYDPGTLTRGEASSTEALSQPQFHYTDAIADFATAFIEKQEHAEQPFFLYAAFTAPHWPLHALEADIARYDGVYDVGWDTTRDRRLNRMRQLGIATEKWSLSPRDADVPAWSDVQHPEWEASRMQAYAGMVEQMDRGVGRILTALESSGRLENTVIVFLSDNGASDEEMPLYDMESFLLRADLVRKETRDGRKVTIGNEPSIRPGGEDTYASYGAGWANVSNTPFRLYKRWAHEGGIATPCIVRYPKGGVVRGAVLQDAYQITSTFPTLLEMAGVEYQHVDCATGATPRSPSMLGALQGKGAQTAPLCWEHTGNAAIRAGSWKLVRRFRHDWELYDVNNDPIESEDVSHKQVRVVAELSAAWQRWATAAGVIPYEVTVDGYLARGGTEIDAQA